MIYSKHVQGHWIRSANYQFFNEVEGYSACQSSDQRLSGVKPVELFGNISSIHLLLAKVDRWSK